MEPATQLPEPKLKIDKFAEGTVTCLKFIGTIDEQFEGKKLAATLKGGTLVLDLADIQKISSFGIREWVDFVAQAGARVDDIILVECAPKVVDQINMVANFVGKGRVFSFYAPYRCDYCDRDSRLLLQTDRDYDAIKNMKPPERPCPNCSNPEYFDEDPTQFFSTLAQQPRFELDPQVAAFLAAKLDYAVSDAARRLRVEKIVEGRSVYLKIGGELDGTFPREKLAEGMEGTVVADVTGVGKIDPAGAAEWRGFLNMITPSSERIFLLGCPPVFLERLTRPEDLGAKGQVLSFVMPYACQKCATTTSQVIDVEQHFEVIKFATPPEMKCPDCGGPTTCSASESLLTHLTTLVKPTIEAPLRKFIKDIQERKPEKKDHGSTTVAQAAAASRRSSFLTILVAAAMAALVAVGVVVYFNYQKAEELKQMKASRDAVGALKNSSLGVPGKVAIKRPAWITADTRFTGTCTPDAGGLSCVGVSSFAETKQIADDEAKDAALEAIVAAVDQKIGNDPAFAQHVRKIYSSTRTRLLGDFEKAVSEDDDTAFNSAKQRVGLARANVAKAFRKTGATFVPAQPTDMYWEESAPLYGTGSRFLVFARYKLTADQVAKLAELYTQPQEHEGARVATVFPGVAWRYPDIQGGAVIINTSSAGKIGQMGLQPSYIVLEINQRQIDSASSFMTTVTQEIETRKIKGGDLAIIVKADDSLPRTFSAAIQGEVVQVRPVLVNTKPRNYDPGTRPSRGAGNVWEQAGGNKGRDNPNE
jgi:anti-anti-sigma regulatory factor